MVIYMCADRENLLDIRLNMLKVAATCHMRLQQYDDALHAWKLCFEHCLRNGNTECEIEVYEQMSYCFLYLGQMKPAEYFNTRWRMGILEEADSQIRHIYASLRKNSQRATKWGH